jgi:UDP-glucose 4-epimerase
MELAELVIRTLGSRSRVRTVPYDQAYAAGFEDLRKRVPDLGRIRSVIGFEPEYTLERTILDVAAAMGGEAVRGAGVGGTPAGVGSSAREVRS